MIVFEILANRLRIYHIEMGIGVENVAIIVMKTCVCIIICETKSTILRQIKTYFHHYKKVMKVDVSLKI